MLLLKACVVLAVLLGARFQSITIPLQQEMDCPSFLQDQKGICGKLKFLYLKVKANSYTLWLRKDDIIKLEDLKDKLVSLEEEFKEKFNLIEEIKLNLVQEIKLNLVEEIKLNLTEKIKSNLTKEFTREILSLRSLVKTLEKELNDSRKKVDVMAIQEESKEKGLKENLTSVSNSLTTLSSKVNKLGTDVENLEIKRGTLNERFSKVSNSVALLVQLEPQVQTLSSQVKNISERVHILDNAITKVISGQGSSADSMRIVCYYQYWTYWYKYPFNFTAFDIPMELCTDVVYNFLGIQETGELDGPRYNNEIDLVQQFASLKTASGPNLFLGVSNDFHGSSEWSVIMADASKRSKFVLSSLNCLKKYGFKGMDLYNAYPKAEDEANFVKLVEELVEAFKPAGFLLTSSLRFRMVLENMNEGYYSSGYDIQRLSELFDWINVRAYNLRKYSDGFVDVHSPLYRRSFDDEKFKNLNVHDGLEMLVRNGAPKHKLMVGVAFFGRTFTLEKSSDNHLHAAANTSAEGGVRGPITNRKDSLAYFEICQKVQSGEWTRRFDDVGKCPYAFHGDQWVGYEDEESIRIKMRYIKSHGYGGTYVDAINMEDFNGFCGPKNALLHAVNQELSKRKVPYSGEFIWP